MRISFKAGGGRSPLSCSADLQKHCATATSPLHCLGRSNLIIIANIIN